MKHSVTTNESFKVTGKMRAVVRDAKTGEVKRDYGWQKNLNPDELFEKIAKLMADPTADFDTAENLLINYIALGSGTTAPASSDTQLQTEVYRNEVASISNSGKIIYVTAFFNDTEVSGTFREAGLFAGATGVADSGNIASRIAVNITKSTSETLTIDWIITVGS